MAQPLSQIVREAVDRAITAVLGEKFSMAFNFYVDPSIAEANPEGFERVLRKLFGEQAPFVLKGIVDDLAARIGLPSQDWESLAACINKAKERYQRS